MVSAVDQALRVISWFENLPKDEQPPRHIWWSEKMLEEWFEDVRDKRGSGRKRSSYEQADDVPMDRNELADGLRPR